MLRLWKFKLHLFYSLVLMAISGLGSLNPLIAMPNPASVFCEQEGGTLSDEVTPFGGYGVCHFGKGYECEEWALYYGWCPRGGVDVSSCSSPQERFCMIRGGEYERNFPGQGECTLFDGTICNALEYFKRNCP